MNEKKEIIFLNKKRRIEDTEREKKDSDKERKIAIFRRNSMLIINVKTMYDLFYILEKINMPYYYYSGEKIYLNYDKNIDIFWSRKENKILYESNTKYYISYDNFLAFHENHKPNNMKFYCDFCFPYYYFSDNEQEPFVNNLDEDVINQLKRTRYFSDYRIIKFFGPQKNAKSTIVYYYFGMRRYIPYNEMFYIEDITNSEKFDENDPRYIKKNDNEKENNQINIIDEQSDEILNELKNKKEEDNNKYFINAQYNKDFKRIEKLNANSEIPLKIDDNLEVLNIFSKTDEIKNKYNEDELKKYNNKIFGKEFYFTRNDIIGFFRSCYLNYKFLQGKKHSDNVKMATLQFEFSGLFKSYKVYQFFINKFNDFYKESKNIIDISEFIIKFMEKYKEDNIRYFIILDGITKNLFEQLNILEKKARMASKCFLIEIFDNEGINEKVENEVINCNNKKDELIIYKENFCEYNENFNLSDEEKIFLSNNFKKNLYYYKKFIEWKNNNYGKDKELFLCEINKDTQKELLKGFTCEEEGKIFYKNIFKNLLNKKIKNRNIVKKINLNYFFIEKVKEKLKLRTLPFIENILNNLSTIPLKNIIYQDYFIKLDEYIKGGIFEEIVKNEIKAIFYKNVEDKKNFQEINIKRLVDNEIYSFYNRSTIEKILQKKKSFMSLKSKLNNKNFKFKNKVTILYCVQNAKHYDLGALFNNTLFIFQITINKSRINIDELLEFLDIDMNYIINKLEFLTLEKDIIYEIYVYLVNMDFESIYSQNNINQINSYIIQNKNKNEKMEKALKDTNIKIIYVSKNFEIFDSNSNKIDFFPTKNDEDIYLKLINNSCIYKMELNMKKNNILNLIMNSKKLPKYIRKDSIIFDSLFYPKMTLPKNSIIYGEYSRLNKSFFIINDIYYDLNFKEETIHLTVDEEAVGKRIILIFSYLTSI